MSSLERRECLVHRHLNNNNNKYRYCRDNNV